MRIEVLSTTVPQAQSVYNETFSTVHDSSLSSISAEYVQKI